MQFSLVLDELAKKCGLGSFEPGGELSLLFDGQHTVTFQSDPDDRSVVLFAEICDVDTLSPDRLGDLMEASLLGSQTEGASFAVARNLAKLILWKRHDDDFSDVAALERAINSFLSAVITWKAKLAEGARGETLPSIRPP
ncbi:MAG: type III secretion system chaperone [Desulfovibrio sp.]|nr:type III secretion system chaperone [Desulfovibrio sp.]